MSIRTLLLLLLVLSAPDVMALEVTMSAAVNDDAQVTVSGTTNLPDGTELLATITDTEGGVYKAAGPIIVNGGTFRSGPFAEPYCTDCTLNIISQIAAYQPPRVCAVIGTCGDLLTGSHVVKGSVGGLIVAYHAKITLKKRVSVRRLVPASNPKIAMQRKEPVFNRYSSYRALKASGRKDLPPMPDALTLR